MHDNLSLLFSFKPTFGESSDDDSDEQSYRAENIPPLTIETERKVMEYLANLCSELLAKYP